MVVAMRGDETSMEAADSDFGQIGCNDGGKEKKAYGRAISTSPRSRRNTRPRNTVVGGYGIGHE